MLSPLKLADRISSLLPNSNWLDSKQSTILSAASVITITSMLSALSGLLVKRSLIGFFFGTPESQQALEAFWIAFQIPDFMFQVIVLGALSAAFIPIFSKHKESDVNVAFKMSSIMMNWLLLLFLISGVFIFIFARPLTELTTGKEFTPEQITIVTNLTRLMIFAQFFFAISNFMTGILQSFQRFVIPALALIFYNLGILIGVLVFHNSMGIYSAGIGVVLGAFLHMGIQLPLVLRLGFKYNFSLDFRYHGIIEFFKLMPPRVVSILANELRKIFLRFFATSLGNLSFFMLQLALTLMAIPIRFFGVSISQASLPFLSDESSFADRSRFKSILYQSLNQISFFTFPAAVLLFILKLPLVRLIFGTANFPWASTEMTGQLVAIIAVSVPAQAMVQLLIRAFYALKDTKTPFLVSIFDLALYLVLSFFFVTFTPYGVYGLAIATSATAIIEFFIFILLLHYKIGDFFSSALWVPQFKILSASFLMAVFLLLSHRIFDTVVFDTKRTVELIAHTITTGTVGMVIYIFFAHLFEIKELKMLQSMVSSIGKWKSHLTKSKEVISEATTDSTEVIS